MMKATEAKGVTLLIALIALAAVPAFADKAEVTNRISGCDWFLAESSSGFVLMEWYGVNDPDKGDVLVGKLNSYGMTTIFNATADNELNVWIDDFMLDRDEALERLVEECE